MKKLAFVSFKPSASTYQSLVGASDLALLEDPEATLRQAGEQYLDSIKNMKSLAGRMEDCRSSHVPISARLVWRFGNEVMEMVEKFRKLSVQVDGLYDHLARDTGMKRKRLEKVVIFRRYIPIEDLIPDCLNWGRVEKGTRRKALLLRDGISVDSNS